MPHNFFIERLIRVFQASGLTSTPHLKFQPTSVVAVGPLIASVYAAVSGPWLELLK